MQNYGRYLDSCGFKYKDGCYTASNGSTKYMLMCSDDKAILYVEINKVDLKYNTFLRFVTSKEEDDVSIKYVKIILISCL